MAVQIKENIYKVNRVNLNVAEAGNSDGPIILFLHGFPEFWYGWQKQIIYFAGKGFRAVAPDQRGYNLSSKPASILAYKIEILVADVVNLIKILTPGKVTLVGHDWGGVVAWTLAQNHPELLHHLVILNMPHPTVMHEHLRKNIRQMFKSWYAGFFQLPKLPELLVTQFDFKILKNSLYRTARPNTFSPTDEQIYKNAWKQPGAISCMINWYRAYKYSTESFKTTIEIPTLLIWGENDAFLESAMAAPSIAFCKQGKLSIIENATHWVHHEKAEEVNELISNFI